MEAARWPWSRASLLSAPAFSTWRPPQRPGWKRCLNGILQEFLKLPVFLTDFIIPKVTTTVSQKKKSGCFRNGLGKSAGIWSVEEVGHSFGHCSAQLHCCLLLQKKWICLGLIVTKISSSQVTNPNCTLPFLFFSMFAQPDWFRTAYFMWIQELHLAAEAAPYCTAPDRMDGNSYDLTTFKCHLIGYNR